MDYEADVFVNGDHVKNHCGGHTSFAIDITDALVSGQEQILSVRAFDPHFDESIPRGNNFGKKNQQESGTQTQQGSGSQSGLK